MNELPSHSAFWVSAGCMMVHLLCVGTIVGFFAWAGRRVLPARCGPGPRYRLTLGCLSLLALSPAVLLPCIEMRVRASSSVPISVANSPPSDADQLPPEAWAGAPAGRPGPSRPAMIEGPSGWGERIQAMLVNGVTGLLAWTALRGPWIWMGGVAMMATLTGRGMVRLRRTCRRARLENGRLQARADAICAGMGLNPIPVKLSDACVSPMLVGWLRTVVLLPGAACQGWAPDQVEMVLLHELTHARRRDNLVNLLQRVFEIAFFFNPAVWYLSRCVRMDAEEICDRAVLARTGRQLAYAQLLLGFASLPAGSRMAMGMGEHNLVSRIRYILGTDQPSGRSRRARASAAVAVGLTLCSIGSFPIVAAVPLPGAGAPDLRDLATIQNNAVPAAPTSSVPEPPLRTDGPAPAADSDRSNPSFLLVDPAGQPVPGAVVGNNVIVQNGQPAWDNGRVQISDARGLVSSPVRSKPNAMTQFYFHDPARHLVGAVGLTSSGAAQSPVRVVMVPACRVRLRLQIPGGDSLTWTKCFIRIANPGAQCRVNDAYLLRQTQTSPAGREFEYDLPPGQYEVVALAGDDNSKLPRTRPDVHCFAVPPGPTSLDLGDLQFSMK